MTNLSSENLWLNIDKPYGFSSAQIVAIVKKITCAKKVGHAGTLDPLATGVLPIAINGATKTSQYLVNAKKKYYFEITWGEFRDTDDKAGKIIAQNYLTPKISQIISALPNFIGKIKQMPPQYSAIKIKGKRAYDLARLGISFDITPREIEIYRINFLGSWGIISAFEIECSKGTYVRSFARELAQILGVCGYISNLRRLEVGNFCVKNIISLDKLKNIVDYDCSDVALPNLRDVLSFMLEVELNDLESLKVRNGQFISQFLSIGGNLSYPDNSDNLVKIINKNRIIGLGNYSNNILKPVVIFNY